MNWLHGMTRRRGVEKRSCICFLKYGKHEFYTDLLSNPGEETLRCIHCDALADSAIRQEQEYEAAWVAGTDVQFLTRMAHNAQYKPNNLPWGPRHPYPWKS